MLEGCSPGMSVLVSGQSGIGKEDQIRKSEDSAPESLKTCRRDSPHPEAGNNGDCQNPLSQAVWLSLKDWPDSVSLRSLPSAVVLHVSLLACAHVTFGRPHLFLCCMIYR